MSRQLIGLCAAAALLAGSHAVHALMVVTAETDTDGQDSVTYATETLLSTQVTPATDDADETVYYNTFENIVTGPSGLAANQGDAFVVAFDLDGMVFSGTDAAALALVRAGRTPPQVPNAFTLISGGRAGDDSAEFRLNAVGNILIEDHLALTARYALSAAGSGDITRTVRNVTLERLDPGSAMMTVEAQGIIQHAPALRESVVANNLTATVASGYNTFANAAPHPFIGAGAEASYLGTYSVSWVAGHLKASDGMPVSMLGDILDATDPTADDLDGNSNFRVEGDFSFVDQVWVASANSPGCIDDGELRPDRLSRDSDVAEDSTVSLFVTQALTPQHVCLVLEVDNEDRMIPVTAPYMVVANYQGIANAAIGPKAMGGMLGAIDRDGTTVHLPYLTTNDKFRQRLRVVNRGGAAVPYEMDFHGAGDVAGDDAEGMFEEGITLLNLGDGNLVEPGNGSSTSATLFVEIMPSAIDVATVQTNRELGTTDTVVYQAE